MKNNNIGYCVLPMINIDVKLEYIIDVKKHDNNTLILVMYNTGLNSFMKYMDYIRSKSNYVGEEDDRVYLKIYDNYIKDFAHIVNGDYKKISASYVKTYGDYFTSVSSLKEHQKNIIRLPRMIVNNNVDSWKKYWRSKLKDLSPESINWILKLMDSSGNYYSKGDKWLI